MRRQHTCAQGIWLITFKKSTGERRVEVSDAVDEAICFGWIDSKVNALDERRSMLWFAPRKVNSGWSRVNKARVKRLIATGRMQPPGLAKIQAAKADGSWKKLDAVEDLHVPPDLAGAMSDRAKKNFDAFPRSAKRAILEWICTAKKPETRARRVLETARLAAKNVRANHWSK